MGQSTTFKILQTLLLVFIFVNLIVLDIKIFSNSSIPLLSEKTQSTSVTDTTNAQLINSTLQGNMCPISCVDLVKEATASISKNIGSPQLETTQTGLSTAKTAVNREYFVPMGSGTTQKSEWEDLTATETVINTDTYGQVKEAQISYALRNPTQNGKVSARLYNVTDKYVVYGSEIEMDGPVSQTIQTNPFAFPTGNKLYRIQLRSTLSYPVYLDGAKIRIVGQ